MNIICQSDSITFLEIETFREIVVIDCDNFSVEEIAKMAERVFKMQWIGGDNVTIELSELIDITTNGSNQIELLKVSHSSPAI